MKYKRGIREEYNIADTSNKIALGWTRDEITKGKEYTDESGDSYTVTETLRKIQNPDLTDDYIWEHTDGNLDENAKYNIVASWKKTIIRPPQKKWFIAYSGSVKTCGAVEIGETMATGLNNLEIFNNEEDFLFRCKELFGSVDKADLMT